jgi:flagellin-like hook-associated protein FlgL
LSDIELNFQKLRSQIEEADLTVFATQLVNNGTIYQAALETTLRVIQPTIFSFIR